MSAEVFTIRTGDLEPFIAYRFGFSLRDAVSVNFSAKDATGAVFINRQPAIIANGTYRINKTDMVLTPEDGVAFYPWAIPDTAVERRGVKGLFHIIWPLNRQETLPSEGFVDLIIGPNF
jgi:hypothetical protein